VENNARRILEVIKEKGFVRVAPDEAGDPQVGVPMPQATGNRAVARRQLLAAGGRRWT